MSMTGDPVAVPMPAGPKYEKVLAAMHRILRPRTYLEVGIDRGETLRLAQCASIAIDPDYMIDHGVLGTKPECLLYRMTSDAFFASRDPVALLGRRIDLAFLDGLHEFEFLLRDFMNAERFCHPKSVILLHDCIPSDLHLARRSEADETLRGITQLQGGWCGDVWKVVPILRRWRPDLRIDAFDAAWTGLVTVTNLDPGSRMLEAAYEEAVATFAGVEMRDYGLRRHMEEMRMQDARVLMDPLLMPRHFGF